MDAGKTCSFHVDLLLIDTEGYDFEILKTIDFSNFRPDLLIFEVSNLDRKDFNASIEILKKNEYQVYINHIDCIALKKNIHLF
ncbi:MAG: FkbM family methyltransferase [Chitinophagaceae bacterium]|nr:FkbM family methyltransferase [Chitinophagaceae bacterium]